MEYGIQNPCRRGLMCYRPYPPSRLTCRSGRCRTNHHYLGFARPIWNGFPKPFCRRTTCEYDPIRPGLGKGDPYRLGNRSGSRILINHQSFRRKTFFPKKLYHLPTPRIASEMKNLPFRPSRPTLYKFSRTGTSPNPIRLQSDGSQYLSCGFTHSRNLAVRDFPPIPHHTGKGPDPCRTGKNQPIRILDFLPPAFLGRQSYSPGHGNFPNFCPKALYLFPPALSQAFTRS